MAEALAGKACPKCGYKRTATESAPDWQCPKCGVAYAKATAAATGQPLARPASAQPTTAAAAARSAPSGPVEAVLAALKGYVNFSGRATRAEYWWFILFWFLAIAAIAFISETLAGIVVLVLLLPNLTVSIRRLHDIGKSGWWYLIGFLPLVGPFILLYLFVQPSDGDNPYGAAA